MLLLMRGSCSSSRESQCVGCCRHHAGHVLAVIETAADRRRRIVDTLLLELCAQPLLIKLRAWECRCGVSLGHAALHPPLLGAPMLKPDENRSHTQTCLLAQAFPHLSGWFRVDGECVLQDLQNWPFDDCPGGTLSRSLLGRRLFLLLAAGILVRT